MKTSQWQTWCRQWSANIAIWAAVGWLVYQLTTQAALGVIVACLQFGMDDVRTAFWIRYRDTKRSRARCAFWFYLAWGLIKVAWISQFAIVAAAFTWVFLSEGMLSGVPNDPLENTFASFMMLVVSFAVGLMVGSIAIVTAWRVGERVWLDPTIHNARKSRLWPPADFGMNEARDVLGAVAAGWMLLFFLGIMVLFTQSGLFPEGPGLIPWVVLTAMLSIAGMACGGWIFQRIVHATVASTPVISGTRFHPIMLSA